METLLHRDQCHLLGQPWTAFTQGEHASRKRRIQIGRRSGSYHRATYVQSRAGFSKGTAKIKEEEDEKEEPPSAGGTKKFIKLSGTVQPKSLQRDNKVVFVAGATGKVGSRTVRELLKLGFQVRASTRSVEKAETLFEDVLQEPEIQPQKETNPFALFSPAKLFGFLKPKPGKQLDIVECDLEDVESIEPALGNAGIVVCCIGASEKEVLDVTGPYRIDFKATKNLIDAASAAQVDHFVLLTSLGTQKIGFPAAVLNLFWGVLIWKAKAENALIESGIPYTIVRPGGMERPTDSYKETHNLVLSEADTLFGGQVSNLQIAELIASIVDNLDVSRNKIVEAVAETTAPLRPTEELLQEIPSIEDKVPAPAPAKGKSSPAISKAKQEVKATKGRGTQIIKEERRQIDEEEQRKLKALREKYEAEIEAAKEKENAALAEKAELEKQAEEIRAKAEAAALAASQAKALEAAILAAAKKGNVLSDEEKQEIIDSVKVQRQLKASSSKIPKAVSKKRIALPFFKIPTIGAETTVADDESSAEEDSSTSTEAKVEKIAEKRRIEGTKEREEEKAIAQQEEQEKAEKETAELKKAEARKKAEAKRKEEEAAAAEKKKKEEEEEEEEAKKAKLLAEEAAKAAAEEAEKEKEKQKKKKEEAEEKQAKLVAVKEAEKEKEEQEFEEEEKKIKESVLEKTKSVQTFRWPWQKTKQEEIEEEEEEEIVDTVSEEKKQETIPIAPSSSSSSSSSVQSIAKDSVPVLSSTPLSPYTTFPGLKPPPPPTSTSSRSSAATETKAEIVDAVVASAVDRIDQKEEESVTEEAKSGSTEDEESRKFSAKEAAAREQEALAKAKAATSFVWPWQKPSPVKEEEEQEEIAAPSLSQEAPSTVNITNEIPARSEAAAASPEVSIPAQQSFVVQTEPKKTENLPRSSTLSPYAGFPELKPPPPPTPSRSEYAAPPTPPPKSEYAEEQRVASVAQTEVKKASPVDNSKETVTEKVSSEIVQDNADKESITEVKETRKSLAEEVAAREREALAKARAATSFTWPWQKPDQAEQTAPPPAVNNADKLEPSSTPLSPYKQFPDLKPPVPSGPSPQVQSSATKTTSKEETLPRSSTPLSPYTGFPGLKPPVPPRPSPPVQTSEAAAATNKEETPPRSSTPLSPYTGFPGLKPPVPPRPSPPVQTPTVAAATNSEETPPRSSTPLSPYTGFPGLKPPTAPVPPKDSDNGALTEVVEEPVGFRWPWQ